MVTSLSDTTTLHNGVKMPWFGLGVYKMQEGSDVIQSVQAAIKHGYRSIDTAALYQNEEGVGHAIRNSGIPREELFITTKVWNSDQGYEQTLQAFEQSISKLGMEYIDLYLIHWPVKGKYIDTWRALEKLYEEKRVRAIGVSNFHVHHLEDLLNYAKVKPMVNQIELHPHLTQEPVREFCNQHGIQVEAWSPLKQGKLLDEPIIKGIATKYKKSVAQIILRWDLQNEIITIPKSVKESRIVENAAIYDFELSPEDMKQLNELNKNERVGPDPDNFDF